jgi:hypothetical protein
VIDINERDTSFLQAVVDGMNQRDIQWIKWLQCE